MEASLSNLEGVGPNLQDSLVKRPMLFGELLALLVLVGGWCGGAHLGRGEMVTGKFPECLHTKLTTTHLFSTGKYFYLRASTNMSV